MVIKKLIKFFLTVSGIVCICVGHLAGDITLKKVRHISYGPLINFSERIQWYQKDSKFCETVKTEMLLGSSKEATIIDLKEGKVWKLDYDDETYNPLTLKEYAESESSPVWSLFDEKFLSNILRELEDMEFEYCDFSVHVIKGKRMLAGYETKGVTALLAFRMKDPFANEAVDLSLIFTLWLAKVNKDKPLRKIQNFYTENILQQNRLSLDNFYSDYFRMGQDLFKRKCIGAEDMDKEIARVIKEQFGDTADLQILGIEFFWRVGDPLNASSSIKTAFASEYIIDVSEKPIEGKIFEIPENFKLYRENEQEDWLKFFDNGN